MWVFWSKLMGQNKKRTKKGALVSLGEKLLAKKVCWNMLLRCFVLRPHYLLFTVKVRTIGRAS